MTQTTEIVRPLTAPVTAPIPLLSVNNIEVVYDDVIPAKAGIQYAAAPRSIPAASGILDHPLSRVMTALGGAGGRRNPQQ